MRFTNGENILKMPRFLCSDVDCEYYGIEELITVVRFVWNDDTGKLEAPEAVCKGCNNQRETVRESGPIAIPWFKAENARNYDNKTVKKFTHD